MPHEKDTLVPGVLYLFYSFKKNNNTFFRIFQEFTGDTCPSVSFNHPSLLVVLQELHHGFSGRRTACQTMGKAMCTAANT